MGLSKTDGVIETTSHYAVVFFLYGFRQIEYLARDAYIGQHKRQVKLRAAALLCSLIVSIPVGVSDAATRMIAQGLSLADDNHVVSFFVAFYASVTVFMLVAQLIHQKKTQADIPDYFSRRGSDHPRLIKLKQDYQPFCLTRAGAQNVLGYAKPYTDRQTLLGARGDIVKYLNNIQIPGTDAPLSTQSDQHQERRDQARAEIFYCRSLRVRYEMVAYWYHVASNLTLADNHFEHQALSWMNDLNNGVGMEAFDEAFLPRLNTFIELQSQTLPDIFPKYSYQTKATLLNCWWRKVFPDNNPFTIVARGSQRAGSGSMLVDAGASRKDRELADNLSKHGAAVSITVKQPIYKVPDSYGSAIADRRIPPPKSAQRSVTGVFRQFTNQTADQNTKNLKKLNLAAARQHGQKEGGFFSSCCKRRRRRTTEETAGDSPGSSTGLLAG